MYTNISTSDRLFRLVVSLGLILSVVSGTGPIGAMAYLPIIALYPGLTASTGWDPVIALSKQLREKSAAKPRNARHGQLVTG